MNWCTAYQIALKWAFCFDSTYFVIRIGRDLYGVTSTIGHGEEVVLQCDGQAATASPGPQYH